MIFNEFLKTLLIGIFILGFDQGICQIGSEDNVVETENSQFKDQEVLQLLIKKELEKLQAIEDEKLEEELKLRPLNADQPQDLPSNI